MAMARRATYRPPALTYRIRLRDPAKAPVPDRDVLGREKQNPPPWGDYIWAGRRDRSPGVSQEDEVEVRRAEVVWTVRNRSGIPANFEVEHKGVVFQSLGPPVQRGGAEFGRGAIYLELRTRRLA